MTGAASHPGNLKKDRDAMNDTVTFVEKYGIGSVANQGVAEERWFGSRSKAVSEVG